MFTDRFFRSISPDADPARRLSAISRLASDSEELAELLAKDPLPTVRVAAANRCSNIAVLASALNAEGDDEVRAALVARLGTVLSETDDDTQAASCLNAPWCSDALRAEVARRTANAERRRAAILSIVDEAVLVDLTLSADIAATRIAAAERVHTPVELRRIAEGTRDKDRGVARLARNRLDAITRHDDRAKEADAILAELEAVASTPGPILRRVIDLNRRWEALDLEHDPERLARSDAVRQTLQRRFEREHAEQRARTELERELTDWIARAEPPANSDELHARRTEVASLRERAQQHASATARESLDQAEQRIAQWERELEALAPAAAIVSEAEELAAATSIDDANLTQRWEALDPSVRIPALARRFEVALALIEQRRRAYIHASQQEASLARQQVHALLHTAEQALATGELQAARAAVDEIRGRKSQAGQLPKPTLQRLGRVTQQLTELERWKSFGQHQACIRLCERAEALASLKEDAPQLAREVQNLRKEWSALEQQHGDVPDSLRTRFNRACEKAYAPAARYFAEQAAARKQARRRREEFIAAVAAHAATLLGEPRDWRVIERWLRETERKWRDDDLGSVEPKAWQALDGELNTALAPLRVALKAEREAAKARRMTLVEEARALVPKALERETPAQVKSLQSRWQAEAKQLTLAKRDEAAVWEQFRAACNSIFETRDKQRNAAQAKQNEVRQGLENLCRELEQLARATNMPEPELRRAARDLDERWKQQAQPADLLARALESRFRQAHKTIEAALTRHARSREAAIWHTLAAKERLCEDVERALCQDITTTDPATVQARWTALPASPAAWEKLMIKRRDAAMHALTDAAAAATLVANMERGADARREMLLELELRLGIESPPDLQVQRRALQLRQLRDRFQGAGADDAKRIGDRLLAWCAQPGVTDARDRQRCDKIFEAMQRLR